MPEKSSLSTSPSPVDIHQALDQVRHAKDFQTTEQQNLLDRLTEIPAVKAALENLQTAMDRLVEALARILSTLEPVKVSKESGLFEQVFYFAMMILLILGLLFLFYLGLMVVRRWLEARSTEPLPPAKTFQGMTLLGSAHHYQAAQERAQVEKYGEAIRQLYLALLCLLDESHQVPFEANRTNLEYLWALRSQQQDQLQGDFQKLSRIFETIRYGHQSGQPASYEACAESYQSALQELLSAGKVTAHV